MRFPGAHPGRPVALGHQPDRWTALPAFAEPDAQTQYPTPTPINGSWYGPTRDPSAYNAFGPVADGSTPTMTPTGYNYGQNQNGQYPNGVATSTPGMNCTGSSVQDPNNPYQNTQCQNNQYQNNQDPNNSYPNNGYQNGTQNPGAQNGSSIQSGAIVPERLRQGRRLRSVLRRRAGHLCA